MVLCVDETSQIQALERIQPVRRVWPGRPEQRTHDYVRHGTRTLFAAREVATGHVIDQCAPRHRHQEFLASLSQVARGYPRRQLHMICDNYATHELPVVRGWLAKHPRIRLHFTPTSASWLNLVEVFFSIVERQALRRGDFASVSELTTAVPRPTAAIYRSGDRSLAPVDGLEVAVKGSSRLAGAPCPWQRCRRSGSEPPATSGRPRHPAAAPCRCHSGA